MVFFFDDFGDQVDTFYTLPQDVFENFTEIFSKYINRLVVWFPVTKVLLEIKVPSGKAGYCNTNFGTRRKIPLII